VISSFVPKGFVGEELIQVNFIAVAHPQHPVQLLSRTITTGDLNRETHVVVSDSGSKGIDAGWLNESYRWAVASLESACKVISHGLGYGWLPETEIKLQLEQSELKRLPREQGKQRTGKLYWMYADTEQPGPDNRQLAEILKQVIKNSAASKQ